MLTGANEFSSSRKLEIILEVMENRNNLSCCQDPFPASFFVEAALGCGAHCNSLRRCCCLVWMWVGGWWCSWDPENTLDSLNREQVGWQKLQQHQRGCGCGYTTSIYEDVPLVPVCGPESSPAAGTRVSSFSH